MSCRAVTRTLSGPSDSAEIPASCSVRPFVHRAVRGLGVVADDRRRRVEHRVDRGATGRQVHPTRRELRRGNVHKGPRDQLLHLDVPVRARR